jgi:TolB protein
MRLAPASLAWLAVVLALPGAASGGSGGSGGTPGLIAFASEAGFNGSHLWLMQVDGTQAHRLLNTQGADTSPAWSPTSTAIAFSALRPTRGWDIYVVNSNGSGYRRVTTARAGEFSPSWSPDGKRIVFQGARDDLYTVSRSGKNLRRLTRTGVCELDPSWSPRGGEIAFTERCRQPHHIVVLNLATGRRSQVTATPGRVPAWSPNARSIAFQSSGTIHIVDLRTKHETTVPGVSGVDGGPRWTADGARLLFDARTPTPCSTDLIRQVFVVGVDGSGLQMLTDPRGCADEWGADQQRSNP